MDTMWAELVTKNPTQEQLWQLVRLVPYLRERAWKEFLKKNPTREDLKQMMEDYCNDHVRSYPGRRIIECFMDRNALEIVIKKAPELTSEAALMVIANPQNDSLVFILQRIQDKTILEKAGQALLKLYPTQIELIAIINSGTPESGKRAAQMLMANESLTDQSISSILHIFPEFAVQIWNKYRLTMGNYPLEVIFKIKPALPFCVEAARMLLGRSTRFSELFELLKHVPELREETWKKLVSMELPENWLKAIERDVPELASRVKPLLDGLEEKRKSAPRTADVICDEIRVLRMKTKKDLTKFD